MDLACLFSPTINTPDHCAVAERLGYRSSWVTDSPTFMADPWITLARAAERTSSIRLGVCALTPRMRHVVATAGAAATLSALAPGRVDIVVGTGFTSQAMINKKPARWSEAEEYVVALRGLLAGEEIEWDGEIVALPYGRLSGVTLPADVAIWVAAHGPKGFDVGRRVADGIVTNPGHGSHNEVWSAGRVFVQVNGTVLEEGESIDSARVMEAAGPAAALHLHIGDEGTAAGSDEVVRFHAELDKIDPRRRHIETHRGHLTELTELERPYVTPELIRAATETGTRAEVRGYLERLADSGVTGALYFPAGSDIARELEAFAEAAAGVTSLASVR
jgi:5,10-methylenetetrahydromethanopterin reductase